MCVCVCVMWVCCVITCVRLRKRIFVDSRTRILRTSVVLLEVVYTVPRREYVPTLILTSTSRARHEKAFFRSQVFRSKREVRKRRI